MLNLTIFCSSKNNLNSIFYKKSELLISLLDENKINIVYGGGNYGLMGTVANTWLKKNGKLISSNLLQFVDDFRKDDYLFDNINDRQKKMIELGDAYLVLPGGYGTHYEMFEVITNNDINRIGNNKKIFILNINNIYDSLIVHINKLIDEKLISNNFEKNNIIISEDINMLVNLINNLV